MSPEPRAQKAVQHSMNNHQVAVLAASMRTGGRTMNSVEDMLEDSLTIEKHLDQRDAQKRRDELDTPGARMMFGQPGQQYVPTMNGTGVAYPLGGAVRPAEAPGQD